MLSLAVGTAVGVHKPGVSRQWLDTRYRLDIASMHTHLPTRAEASHDLYILDRAHTLPTRVQRLSAL